MEISDQTTGSHQSGSSSSFQKCSRHTQAQADPHSVANLCLESLFGTVQSFHNVDAYVMLDMMCLSVASDVAGAHQTCADYWPLAITDGSEC